MISYSLFVLLWSHHYVHRVKLHCIDYSLHRLPMRTIANYFHLDWLPGQLPTDLSAGARGKEGRYKKRELRTHWVPGGDQETGQPNERTKTNERTTERTNGRTEERKKRAATERSSGAHAIVPENSGCWLIKAHTPWAKGRKPSFIVVCSILYYVHGLRSVDPLPVYPRTAGSGMEENSTDEPWKPSEATDVNDSTFTIPNIKGSRITI